MCFKKKKNFIFEEDLYKNNKAPLFSASDYAKDEEAFLNPFVNKCEQEKSIEEYAVKFKKNIFSESVDVYLGSVLRNDFIPKKKKWKTFKNYLKKIKKEYHQSIESLEEKKKSNQIIYETFKVKRLSKIMRRFILLICIINLLITVISKIFFNELFNDSLFLGLIISGYTFIVSFFIFLFVHKRKYYNINNIQRRYTRKLNKYFLKEKRNFKKYYNMLYNYYYDNIFSGHLYYEAKDFNAFWNEKYSYNKALEDNENIENNIRRLVDIQKRYKIISSIFVIFDIINLIALITIMILILVK